MISDRNSTTWSATFKNSPYGVKDWEGGLNAYKPAGIGSTLSFFYLKRMIELEDILNASKAGKDGKGVRKVTVREYSRMEPWSNHWGFEVSSDDDGLALEVAAAIWNALPKNDSNYDRTEPVSGGDGTYAWDAGGHGIGD